MCSVRFRSIKVIDKYFLQFSEWSWVVAIVSTSVVMMTGKQRSEALAVKLFLS